MNITPLLLCATLIAPLAQADTITEDDPLVGTWVGVSFANQASKNGGDLAIFACWVTGGSPSGVCHGASRKAGDPSALELGKPFPVWIEHISGNWYNVAFKPKEDWVDYPLILDVSGNSLTTALLTYRGKEGRTEVSTYYRGSPDLDVQAVADYYLR